MRLFAFSAAIAALVAASGVFAAPSPAPANSPACKAALVMNLSDGALLAQHAPELAVAPASLTKIMSLFVLFDAMEKGEISMLDQVRISAAADRTGGSSMGALTNRQYPLWTVMRGIAVASGNDAAQAAAEFFPGGYDAFIKRMNETARDLGMEHSYFVNPHGLPDPRQISTARDMLALAAEYIRRFPQALRFHAMPFCWNGEQKLRNRNKLLGSCPGVDGLKTGYVRQSGYNVIVTAKRGGVRLVAVILGAPGPKRRAKEAARLLEAGFAQAGVAERPRVSMAPPASP